jgi:hypothetical protein
VEIYDSGDRDSRVIVLKNSRSRHENGYQHYEAVLLGGSKHISLQRCEIIFAGLINQVEYRYRYMVEKEGDELRKFHRKRNNV